jgi:4-amino-4-deoxy-L-arabinose transferase-like glycosyltransferase
MAHEKRATAALLAMATFALVLHAAVGGRYGYFRDELYYLACTDHLAFGYVDHPPLSIALLWVMRRVFGDALWAIRLLAWLSMAVTVFATGLLARELGGGRFAQVTAALCVLVGPVYLAVGHFYSMNALDVLLWTLAAFAFARAVASGRPAWWIALGVLLGLGLENKISVLWLGAGIAAALVLTSARRWLRTPWPWASGAVAAVLSVPHVIWQVRNGWPTLEFMHNATTMKMVRVSPLDFLVNEIVVQHPITFPIWAAGLVFLFAAPRAYTATRMPHRALAWVFAVPAAILIASGTSRANYLSPAFPILFAGGGVALGAWVARTWTRAGILAALAAFGAVTAPLGLPLLQPDRFIAYAQALRLAPRAEERTRPGLLPQHYADQFGWRELAVTVGEVYFSLSPEERQKCAILATNYGRAGAIDFFGPALGLPPAISGHNNYFLWGPRAYTGEVMIVVGGSVEDHAPHFAEVRLVARTSCRYCMPYEDGVPIFLCRGLRTPLPTVWGEVKQFI